MKIKVVKVGYVFMISGETEMPPVTVIGFDRGGVVIVSRKSGRRNRELSVHVSNLVPVVDPFELLDRMRAVVRDLIHLESKARGYPAKFVVKDDLVAARELAEQALARFLNLCN